jgi:hypothetical protein
MLYLQMYNRYATSFIVGSANLCVTAIREVAGKCAKSDGTFKGGYANEQNLYGTPHPVTKIAHVTDWTLTAPPSTVGALLP